MRGSGTTVSDTPTIQPLDRRPLVSLLAVGFGTTVAMWGVGYLGRLPAIAVPSSLLLFLLLACLVAGGLIYGRHRPGLAAAAAMGAISGLLNLLILGSFVSGVEPGRIVPSVLWWVPGSILASAVLAAFGGAAGSRWFASRRPPPDWTAAFARVAVVATLLLLGVGGLVTSAEAGLAVVDWPRSFGYNMFLYPFSRMTGNVFYEHAHRLFGALVGLTTLALACVLQRTDSRRWVRRLGWLALALVVLQGLLGGLRVTGRFTMSTDAEALAPNLALAAVHGILAQLFFSLLAALAVFTSARWRAGGPSLVRSSVRVDRALSVLLLFSLIVQLVLGAVQRHFSQLLVFHIVLGVAVVAPLTLHLGFRGWGLNAGLPAIRRLGLALVGLLALQVGLGFVAFARTGGFHRELDPGGTDLLVATLHQWMGAVLLGATVVLLCWNFRFIGPDRSSRGGADGRSANVASSPLSR